MSQLAGEQVGSHAPLPVALGCAGGVEAGLFSLDQEVLDGNDAEITDAAEGLADEVPGESAVIGVLGVDKAAGKVTVVIAALLDPGPGGRIVVGAGVDNGILHMIVREIVAGFAGVKGELENLHARIAGALEKLLGRGCDIAQVLRDDRDVAEFFFHSAEEVLAGSFDNLAVLGGLVTVRDLVVFRKSVEVVQADDIVELKVAGKALDPPAITVFFEFFPVVDRIAPELACGREGIRRTG